MDAQLIVDWSREALVLALILGGPPLLAALAAGLLVGALQTMTQMSDPTPALVARLAAVFATLFLLIPWMLGVWADHARALISGIPDRLF